MTREYLGLLESQSAGLLTIDEHQEAWPSLGRIELDDRSLDVALYVRPITLGGRSERFGIERRFQNPGQESPIVEVDGRTTLLLGVWSSDSLVDVEHPVVALAEASRRIGLRTRWPVFIPLPVLQMAAHTGWASHRSGSGERVLCFHPSLISLALYEMNEPDVTSDTTVQRALRERDLVAPERSAPLLSAEVRTRRSVTALVRDARFRTRVVSRYGGRCAMCDLGLSLVQGAHIYPASAPGATDDVSNGIALCANHHVAFDRHQIAVDTRDLRIFFRPDVWEQLRDDSAAERFIRGTLQHVRLPSTGGTIDTSWLTRRYDYFRHEYSWLDRLP